MIYGIGTDVVEITRVERLIDRFGQAFLDRIFTASEQRAGDLRRNRGRFYAMRFAAKEAAWKALATRHKGIGWHDLVIGADSDGKPELHFEGRACEIFDKISSGRGVKHLSLSDDGGMALAFVVLSAS